MQSARIKFTEIPLFYPQMFARMAPDV